MEMRTLGNTGLRVSVLGFGGAPMGFLELEQTHAARMLNALLDCGVNLIDTAAMYAGSEEVIGQSVSHRRNEFVLVTKSPSLADGDDCWSSSKILASVDRSLQRLRTERIDVVLLHSCGKDVLERGEALDALLKAKDAGKIRFAGYSGDNEVAAYAADLAGVSVIETSLNICDQANLKSVLPKAQSRGIGVIAKRPMANSAWRPLSEQKGVYADYARAYTQRFSTMGLSISALGLAGSPFPEWPEVALRFTLSQPGVHAAIVGTCQLPHAKANIQAAARGALPEKAVRLIHSAFLEAEARSGQTWLGEI